MFFFFQLFFLMIFDHTIYWMSSVGPGAASSSCKRPIWRPRRRLLWRGSSWKHERPRFFQIVSAVLSFQSQVVCFWVQHPITIKKPVGRPWRNGAAPIAWKQAAELIEWCRPTSGISTTTTRPRALLGEVFEAVK